ncbi:MAG TPA: hypothetical protein VHW45_08770 [Candidatus Sulfotelmatobacter sp.]|nr:hypothetical protein [Candidatus Sulfotelmatobacter sp.]
MRPAMDATLCNLVRLCVLFAASLPAFAQKILPPLVDGTVVQARGTYRHDGPLYIQGKVKLSGIDLDLRGPMTVAAGADLELDHVNLEVSDPTHSANGASGLHCEGPAKITIRNSKMTERGSAHPMWRLQGQLNVDDFQTQNSEFHLDHVKANLTNFSIFELEISHSSEVVGKHLRLVFLSTHTGDHEKLEFSDIPAKQPFSRTMRMGSEAQADLTDVEAELFLVYVHGRSDVTLNRIERAQLAMFPTCHGTLTLPHGRVGSTASPVIIPDPNVSDCQFRFRLADVNADTWDVYAGTDADLTFTDSVIDELNADGHAKVLVRDSEVYADWLSLGGDAKVKVENSTVGAQRLAAERPDLATSQVRLSGNAEAAFDRVKFDCGVVAGGSSNLRITDSVAPPTYLRQADKAVVNIKPSLPIEHFERTADK